MPPQNQPTQMIPKKTGMPTWLKVILVICILCILGFASVIGVGYVLVKNYTGIDFGKMAELSVINRPEEAAKKIHELSNAGKTPAEITQYLVNEMKNVVKQVSPKTPIPSDQFLYDTVLKQVQKELSLPDTK